MSAVRTCFCYDVEHAWISCFSGTAQARRINETGISAVPGVFRFCEIWFCLWEYFLLWLRCRPSCSKSKTKALASAKALGWFHFGFSACCVHDVCADKDFEVIKRCLNAKTKKASRWKFLFWHMVSKPYLTQQQHVKAYSHIARSSLRIAKSSWMSSVGLWNAWAKWVYVISNNFAFFLMQVCSRD